MAIRKVARLGHPILRQKARELSVAEILSSSIAQLIADMRETMHDYGGIGLAAPQVHESIQLAIIGSDSSDCTEGVAEADVYINPVITVLDAKEQGYWEGCLSVPGLRGLVFRPRKIRVDYLDFQARPRVLEAEGFRATVFQHELDHLAGVLYVDRIEDLRQFAFTEEYEKFWLPAAGSELGELTD